ncbi:MAG: hypothetical protein ACYCVZ_10955 [Streptosporangiaceae bacterium]
MTFTPLHLALGWDEVTSIAQTSIHSSPITLPPAHARGVGLLAAPVTLLTTSVFDLRVWMAVLSGIGIFLALFCWRGLRPGWVLAVAGLIFGGLAVTQLSGPAVMPDLWEAIGVLALTGLFLQAVHRRLARRVVLPLLAFAVCFLILIRFQDAAFAIAPLGVALLAVPAWRRYDVLAALVAGGLAGTAEWVWEDVAFYGSVAARMHAMASQPPKAGIYFSLIDQLRLLDGPNYCGSGYCPGLQYPQLFYWWLALLLLVILGLFAGRTMHFVSCAVAVAVALSILGAYTLFMPIAAPRYMLPILAVLAVPAADGIAWLATRANLRLVTVPAVAVFLIAEVVTQHFVLRTEIAATGPTGHAWVIEARDLSKLGVKSPCFLAGATPVAYYLGCTVSLVPNQGQTVLIGRAYQPPPGQPGWRQVYLPGLPGLISYVKCTQAPLLGSCRTGGPGASGG